MLVDNPTHWTSYVGVHRRKIRKKKVLNEVVRVSLQNSLQILVKNDLLERDKYINPVRYRLKNKGTEKAMSLRKEIRSFIQEFQHLV